ncbi:hypothetical protein OEZ71_03695 [Defluviimonas sp. WL0050]|uniref:Dihydroorotate dehydrogenase n=1 Tax=Albidovulum litorale TaxID=2984134 RepID=A0ABT2ZJU7_9RHOB|nr:hypothetical protein [Defluviimonas sp. WL0050]MCV2871393.1 hypothetical protein [Defluviimonas sp. WL0050]
MTDRKHDDDGLEGFFSAARAYPPEPSEALLARVLADAEAARPAPVPVRGPGLLSRIGDLLGGWQGLGGLATATVAGLWIGYAELADPDQLTGGLVGASDVVDLLPQAELFALAMEMEE